ncbi:hypothetical protein E0K83_12130 [Gramella sp. BOM4]|nr:hypothetical protein [Christiangramia bathymodioli]
MKQVFLTLLCSCMFLILPAHAQEHRKIGAECKFYVPNNGTATPDASTSCPVCSRERQEEYERQAAIEREKQRQREEKIAQENARFKEQQRAEKQAWEDRNTVALNKLQNLGRESEAYDRLRKEESVQKDAIRKRYDQQVEKSNREYNEYLSRLQEKTTLTPITESDPFWNETVTPANYIPFSQIIERKELFGYKDRNGNLKIAPKYRKATYFSGGVAFVQEENLNKSTYRLINSRDETVVNFDDAFLRKISAQVGKEISQWNIPDTITDGLVILRLGSNNSNSVGVLDKKGDVVVPPIFNKIEGFKNGVSVASKLIESDEYTFENFPRNYYANFKFLEVGLIDKKGNWMQPPKKKMEYNYWSSAIGYLTVTDSNERLTAAEKRYRDEQWELTKKKRYDESMKQLEQEVQRRVSQAQTQGYLIENTNTN